MNHNKKNYFYASLHFKNNRLCFLKEKELFTPPTSSKGTITYLFRKNIFMPIEKSMNLE